jgi:transcriptional regulator with XRE-family HTH domain
MLAGVSMPYYSRLERGDLRGVSESVLQALAGALRLDADERVHLFDLARAVQPAAGAADRRQPEQHLRPAVRQIVDAIADAAAIVRNDRLDILGANQLGHALYQPMFSAPERPVNSARFIFLDPRSRDFYADWDSAAADVVAVLRAAAGRDPYDRGLSDLVGELATQSEAFRVGWAAHAVRFHVNGIKHYRHPDVGELILNFERLELAADPGLTIFTYTAEPGSRSDDGLRLLGSWAATQNRDATQPAEPS